MKLRFKLNHLYQGQNAPFLHAVDAGLFAERGLEVEFVEGFSSSLVTRAIASGEADCGYGDVSSLMTHAVDTGAATIQAVMPVYRRSPCALGYLRPGPALALHEIEGGVLCGPRGDTSARLLPLLLAKNGLAGIPYEMRFVDPEERDALVAGGRVLAATCFDATLKFAMIMRGHDSSAVRFLYFADHGLDIYTGAVVCRADLLVAHPRLLDDLRAVTHRAWLDCLADPALGVAAVTARAPWLDPALVRAQLEWVTSRQIFPDGPSDMAFERDGDQMAATVDCALLGREGLGAFTRESLIAAVCPA
ncbi:ABC transporter substrate-binding protein [Prosthecomicrobium sp. N25]|uniref:ABC transporter substrate-binding protein n=1 Tax=Prosthecomicrobium sp. N25 TaxID=3129254 RepID=UPI00307808C2